MLFVAIFLVSQGLSTKKNGNKKQKSCEALTSDSFKIFFRRRKDMLPRSKEAPHTILSIAHRHNAQK